MNWNIDLPFIIEVGQNINDILKENDEQNEWLNEVINIFYDTQDFPPDSIDHIKAYLGSFNKEEYNILINKIDCIIADENVDNLLNNVFFPSNGEEEYPGEEEEEEAIIFSDGEEEFHEVNGESTPTSYFLQIVTNFKNPLSLSKDIAYLILKKYGWNIGQAQSAWFSNSESILKSLRINVGSSMVPDLQSSLYINKSDRGQCPICHEDKPLLKLYCGHQFCLNCLEAEIKTQTDQNKLPFCHQLNKIDNTECNSEIIIQPRFLKDDDYHHKLFQSYKSALLYDRLHNNSIHVKSCPNCSWYITFKNRINDTTGICTRCRSAVCFKCNNGAHFPLENCSQVDEFLSGIPDQMNQLYSEQMRWIKREENLKEIHCAQKSEIQQVLNESIQELKTEHQEDALNDQKRVDQVDDIIKKSEDNINRIKDQIREYVAQKKPISEFTPLTQNILFLRETIEKKQEDKERVIKENKSKEALWNTFLKSAESDNNILINGCKDATTYLESLKRFEKAQSQHAYEKIDIDSKNFELNSYLSVPCPKCKRSASTHSGINQMRCNCGNSVCLVCRKEWDANHQSLHACPKYMLNLTNDNSSSVPNDNKFYKQPMTLTKRSDFFLFINLYAQYKRQKEIYDNLAADYKKREDKGIKYSLDLPDSDLCPLNRLIRCFSKDTGAAESEKLSFQILNTILLSQSALVWGFPAIYFVRKNKNPQRADMIETNLFQMRKHQQELIKLINEPSKSSKSDILNIYSKLESSIKEIIPN